MNIGNNIVRAAYGKFVLLLIALLSIGFLMARPALGQSVPADFSFEISSAARIPGNPREPEFIKMGSDGTVEISAKPTPDGELPATTLNLDEESRATIYAAVTQNNFFTLSEVYNDETIRDGDYANLTITADGKTHTVRTINIKVKAFERIIESIYMQLPPERWVIYNALHVESYKEVER